MAELKFSLGVTRVRNWYVRERETAQVEEIGDKVREARLRMLNME